MATGVDLPNWLARATTGFDAPAQKALACLSNNSLGFSVPVDEFDAVALATCARTLRFDAPFVHASVVGRSLGSDELRVPVDGSIKQRFTGQSAKIDAGNVRRVAVLAKAQEIFVAFTPALSADGKASQFGRYEFLMARAERNLANTDAAAYTDFLIIDNSDGVKVAENPPSGTCPACHQDGKPILSVVPWSEMTAVDPGADLKGYDDIVRRASKKIQDRQWLAFLGDGDYALRQLVVSHALQGPPFAAFGRLFFGADDERDESVLAAAMKNRAFTPAGDELKNRLPTDPVPLTAGYDPLVPRNKRLVAPRAARTWLEALDETLLRLGFSVVRDDVNRLIDGKRAAFLSSAALQNAMMKLWPITPAGLREAAQAFCKDPAPADLAHAQQQLDAANAPAAAPPPDSAEQAFTDHCQNCHFEGGLVPALESSTLFGFVGKYPSRTAAILMQRRLMPPGPIDAASLELIRSFLEH